MIVNGREVDYYCGTSYYPLHGHPLVIEAACDAVRKYGLRSATTSTPVIEEVVELSRGFFETDTATYVISGYLGAMIPVPALSQDYDIALVDDRSHYSVFDGVRTSGKKVVLFRHFEPRIWRGSSPRMCVPARLLLS